MNNKDKEGCFVLVCGAMVMVLLLTLNVLLAAAPFIVVFLVVKYMMGW